MPEIKRYRVLDTPVDAANMSSALNFVEQAVATRNAPGFILAVNPEKVFLLRRNPALKRFFRNAALLIPDGIGMVKALGLLLNVRTDRVPGADLMQQICAAAPGKNYRLFILGSTEKVNRNACEVLAERHPGIQIVGRADGFTPAEEMDALVERINRSGADILFVAMGSPRQEQWMMQYGPRLKNVKLCQGIGGTLDTIAGTVKRAPVIWQRLGLEWFFRLLCQPTRGSRQLRCFAFAWEVLRARLSGAPEENREIVRLHQPDRSLIIQD